MLEQVRIPRGNRGLDQLMPDLSGMQNVQQLRLDINRLVAARYFIIFMGAVLLLSVVAQALFFDGGVSLSRVFKVALVSLLGPGLVWAASAKEVRLLQELDKSSQQLEQRVQENKALNRMTQAHLADCLSVASAPDHPAPQEYRSYGETREVFTSPTQFEVRSDFQNVIVLDPDDHSYDRRYFEPAGSSRITIIEGAS